MSAELAAGVVERELGDAARAAVRRVGPRAHRLGVDRPGPPGHHPRRAGGGGQGAVPRGRRGDPRRPRQRRAAVRRHGHDVPGPRPGPLVDEIRSRVVEELDYEHEARNQQLFADWYRGHPFIHVPDVLPELSTAPGADHRAGRRASASTRCSRGARTSATWPPRRSTGSCSARCTGCTPSTATPTPATTCSGPGGQVTFLDFGLVKHFTADEIDVFERMIDAMVLHRDLPRFRRIIEEIGLLQAGHAASPTTRCRTTSATSTSSSSTTRTVTITPEWSSGDRAAVLRPNGPLRRRSSRRPTCRPAS